jgi:hypothetical protein
MLGTVGVDLFLEGPTYWFDCPGCLRSFVIWDVVLTSHVDTSARTGSPILGCLWPLPFTQALPGFRVIAFTFRGKDQVIRIPS